MHRRTRVLGFALLVAVLVMGLSASTAFAATANGQAVTAKSLSPAVRVTKGARSTMTFSIRKSNGSKVTGYAVSGTKYYQRGPNDEGYHRVARSDAYTVFTNWGGGGYCPSKLVYTTQRYKGKTRKVLSKVYYFMAGE